MEYFNYFTLLHAVVIAGLCVMLYQQFVLTKVREAVGILFECITQMSKGKPVRIIQDADGNLEVKFPGRDVEEVSADDEDY